MEDHNIYEFGNGIRLIHKQVNNTKIIHCAYILDIGSRDEGKSEQGLAHFWEHMAFKGTVKRKAFHIINKLESVGGELNAFTQKEKICFYASVQEKYFNSAVELLTDITFHSTFPSREIEKERQVILDEMMMYLDIPEESILDDFETMLYPHHPIGCNILGTAKSIEAVRQTDFMAFIRKHLNSSRIVISVVGNVGYDVCRNRVERYVRELPTFKGKNVRVVPSRVQDGSRSIYKNISRSYCAMGSQAFSIKNENRFNFFMLLNILGGPAMNSRLNMELRERKGLVYSIDAVYTPYSDTGTFGIFFGTDPGSIEKAIYFVQKEIQKLKTKPLGALQLHQSKEQLSGQLAMAEENNVSMMIMMGKSLLDLGYVDLLEDIVSKIEKIRSGDLIQLARRMLDYDKMSKLLYLPADKK